MGVGVVGLGLFAWGTVRSGRRVRVDHVALLPLVFLLVPLIQSTPLPPPVRRLLDPKGDLLLADSLVGPTRAAPLSLDPPSTRVNIGKAAAALAVFLVAYHFASSRRRRRPLLRVLGLVGVAAVLMGIGHRVLGVSKLYGLLASSSRTILVGPFVNSNHSAEFLELAAFICLACSFQRPTALNRIGWLTGTAICLAGTVATLSRGAVVAVATGVVMFAFLRYISRADAAVGRRRASLAWGALLIGLALLGTAAVGAGQLIDRFHSTALSDDLRFGLWRDSLRVIAAHPFGIGRGAFDRVFPVYRTLTTQTPMRFAFVENQPLQLLIDCGWFFFALVVAATGLVIWRIARHGRRDAIEAALIAGLFALVIHNLVDFGLETLGVLLPFVAVLGIVLGRLQVSNDRSFLRRGWPIVSLAGVGLIVGFASVAHASSDDFDALLAKTQSTVARHALLERAQRVHPTDYYYALLYARLEPLRLEGGPSPRFHALNRALTLCPSCDLVHVEVARNLWALGSRRQALLEWRSAIALRARLLTSGLRELFAAGATPRELASLAANDPPRLTEVAGFLSGVSHIEEAIAVLDEAETLGAPQREVLLTRARLQLIAGHNVEAETTLSRLHALGFQDARVALVDADVVLAMKGPAGADAALAILDQAAAQFPLDVRVQRARVDLVMKYSKWQAADRSLEGLKQALSSTQVSLSEAHVAAARMSGRLARWTKAFGEYRMALADDPGDVPLWMEFGRAAATAGRNATSREAYAEANRLSPNNPEVAQALRELDRQMTKLRASDLGAGSQGQAEP
jgi:tetratricopeptide (TPR) repeat protein/O-antigen ligase